MRTISEDERAQENGSVEGNTWVSPTGTRRAVLGLTAGGLAQATSGLLLPARLAGEAAAAEGQVEVEHRPHRRRRRRRRHSPRIEAAAFLGLAQPIAIRTDQQTPILLDMGVLFDFAKQGSSIISTMHESHQYQIDLFLTWSLDWNGRDTAVCRTGFRVVDNKGKEQVVVNQGLMNAPFTTVTVSQTVFLHLGYFVEVFGQVTRGGDPGAQVHVAAGAISVYALHE